MTRILPSLRLTKEQSALLVKIKQAATPHLAKAETENGQKAIVAAGILKDLGAISIDRKGASVTSSGETLLKDEGLVDDTGNLTPIAKQQISGEKGTAPSQSDGGMGGAGGGMGGLGGLGGGSSGGGGFDLGSLDLGMDDEMGGEGGDLDLDLGSDSEGDLDFGMDSDDDLDLDADMDSDSSFDLDTGEDTIKPNSKEKKTSEAFESWSMIHEMNNIINLNG